MDVSVAVVTLENTESAVIVCETIEPTVSIVLVLSAVLPSGKVERTSS